MGSQTRPVSSLVGPRSSQCQGSISMGMIVRMTSSLPLRTTTRKLESFFMDVLTSVAEEIRWPLMEMMTSCSLSPPLQNRQTKEKEIWERIQEKKSVKIIVYDLGLLILRSCRLDHRDETSPEQIKYWLISQKYTKRTSKTNTEGQICNVFVQLLSSNMLHYTSILKD